MSAIAGVGQLTVEIDGAALEPGEAACLARVRARHALSLPAQCELTFQGISAEFADRAAGLVGRSLTVRTDSAAFEGQITALEHGYGPDAATELRVRAYDVLHRLRKRQTVQFRDDIDAGELCRQFAGDLGLSADVSEDGPRWPRLAQWLQTDFELLAGVAARAGLYFAAGGGKLRLFTLQGWGDPITLTLGEDLLEATFEVNGDRAWTEVVAAGWDVGTGKRFDDTVGSARSGRSLGVPASTADVGGAPRRTLTNLPAADSSHVRADAQAELDRATANALTVRGVAAGQPDLLPGAKVSLEGVHAKLSGTYVVSEVVHTLDAERGFLSEFSTAVPPSPLNFGAAVVAQGQVSQVDDPDNQGRVTVRLPGYQKIETGWMRVLLPAAGKEKGFIALPDEGDEVLVLFPGGDPAAGVVLGGLFGTDNVPDTGITDKRVKRHCWRSPDGHYIEIDDAKDQMTLTTANGSMIRLGKNRLTISSATDLEITAAGHSITITASSVDFRQG
jgi:phage baseplate assembly protein V